MYQRLVYKALTELLKVIPSELKQKKDMNDHYH